MANILIVPSTFELAMRPRPLPITMYGWQVAATIQGEGKSIDSWLMCGIGESTDYYGLTTKYIVADMVGGVSNLSKPIILLIILCSEHLR